MAEEQSTPTSTKWWQWVLMYPALFVALIGNIPNLYQLYLSQKLNVPVKQVPIASYRDSIFEQNRVACLTDLQLHPVPSGDNTSIFVGVCPRQALVVLVQPNDPKAQLIFRLISWSELDNKPQTSLLVKEAAAEESSTSFKVAQGGTQGVPTIICQRRVDQGRLLIRISYPNGKCFDQTVNTYTGAVVSTVPASCDQRCQ
jgi:hypothetical protein